MNAAAAREGQPAARARTAGLTWETGQGVGRPRPFRGSVASPPRPTGQHTPPPRCPVLVGSLLPGSLLGRRTPQTLNKEKGAPNILLLPASPVFPSSGQCPRSWRRGSQEGGYPWVFIRNHFIRRPEKPQRPTVLAARLLIGAIPEDSILRLERQFREQIHSLSLELAQSSV